MHGSSAKTYFWTVVRPGDLGTLGQEYEANCARVDGLCRSFQVYCGFGGGIWIWGWHVGLFGLQNVVVPPSMSQFGEGQVEQTLWEFFYLGHGNTYELSWKQ